MTLNTCNSSNYSSRDIELANQFLQSQDTDGDGNASIEEFAANNKKLYEDIFAQNDKLSAKAEKIADKQAEVYAKYAGDDGILSTQEYMDALNSDENSALLDEYWTLYDGIEN